MKRHIKCHIHIYIFLVNYILYVSINNIKKTNETLPSDLIASFSMSKPENAYITFVHKFASKWSIEYDPSPGR